MKVILPVLCFVLIATSIQGQELSEEQVTHDVESFIGALNEGHPGITWYNSKEDIDRVINDVQSSIKSVTSVDQLHVELHKIIEAISCGHTTLLLPQDHYQLVDSTNNFLPFNITLIENKVIVSESFTDELLTGDQILSINNEPIDQTITRLIQYIPVDKEIETKKYRSIEIVFPYYYEIYSEKAKSYTIEFLSKGSDEINNTEIKPIKLNDKMFKSVRNYASAQFPIEWNVHQSDKIATLKLATFNSQAFISHKINYRDTLRSIFEELHDKNINSLILDLRSNNGGTMPLAEHLLSYFVDSTYQYYLEAEIKKHVMTGSTKIIRSRNMLPMMEGRFGPLELIGDRYRIPGDKQLVEPSKPYFSGELYVITNGLSFSATASFVAHIQDNSIGKIFGETPGGAYNGINAGPPLEYSLPNSKLQLYFRALSSRYDVDQKIIKADVDHPITVSLNDYLEGKDSIMDKVIELVKAGSEH